MRALSVLGRAAVPLKQAARVGLPSVSQLPHAGPLHSGFFFGFLFMPVQRDDPRNDIQER